MAKVLRQIDDEAIERPFNKGQFFRLLGYMKPYKGRVAVALCLMVLTTLCSLGQTWLLSRAIGVLQAETPRIPWLLVGGMVLMAATIAICTRYRVRLMDFSGRRALATELGQPGYRGRQLAQWLYARGARSLDQMTDLPAAFRTRLAERVVVGRSQVPVRMAVEFDQAVRQLVQLGQHRWFHGLSGKEV